MVMSGWDKAPSGDGVTIVFTFIKHMKELEDWQEKQGVNFVDEMIHAYHTQVRPRCTRSAPHQLLNDGFLKQFRLTRRI